MPLSPKAAVSGKSELKFLLNRNFGEVYIWWNSGWTNARIEYYRSIHNFVRRLAAYAQPNHAGTPATNRSLSIEKLRIHHSGRSEIKNMEDKAIMHTTLNEYRNIKT